MKNFVQNGSRITFAASAVVTPNNSANLYGGASGDGPLSGEQGDDFRLVWDMALYGNRALLKDDTLNDGKWFINLQPVWNREGTW